MAFVAVAQSQYTRVRLDRYDNEYPVVIEYVRKFNNTIAHILSRVTSFVVNEHVLSNLARSVPTILRPMLDAGRHELRND